MQLKNVVLPAPLGPMSETIALLGHGEVDVVDRDEAAEELRDAGRLEDVVVAVTAVVAHGLLTSIDRRRRTRPRAARACVCGGDEALGPQHHHHQQQEAEDAEGDRRDVEVEPELVRHAVELGQQEAVDHRQRDRAEDHAPDVAHAAEDDHAEDEHREAELELVDVDGVLVRAQEHAGEAAERGADRVGPELRRARG